MKNDIDEILNSVFQRSEKTGKSRAAMEAEEFLRNLDNKTKTTVFDEEIRQIEEAQKAATENLKEINRHLSIDGIKTEDIKMPTAQAIVEEVDINECFLTALEKTKSKVIGQDEFLRKLFLAFKRPFVMGKEENKPKSTMIITGKTGTGRHSAVNYVMENLSEHKLIEGEKPLVIDLGIYTESSDSKLFVQDLFSAIEAKSQVILFENYEKCHKSLLSILNELVLKARVQLGARYANQKGMLIDVGTALVPNVISSISCEDKYLIILTSQNQSKLVDNLGSNFMNNVDDICQTESFSQNGLKLIAQKIITELKEKTAKILNFNIEIPDELSIYFSGKFTVSSGINSIEEYSLKCYKALSEYKLETSKAQADCAAILEDGVLSFVFDDKTIFVENHYDESAAVTEVKAKMDEIIGLESVKNYIVSLEENFKVQKLRNNLGLKTESPSMHMIFTGNPGTGKTTIARIVSRYLKAMGILSGGQLIEVSRGDLVGKYVGHTSPLTRQVIDSAIGGVLFIDEAYSLYRGKDDTFGLEAIDTLVKAMEDNRDNLLVILAGYTNEMESFLESNSGLVSRFPNLIEFPDYTADELWGISEVIAKNKGYTIDLDAKKELLEYYTQKQLENSVTLGNGRMARNVIENAILKQSQRLIKENSQNYEQLLNEDFELEND